LPALFEKVFAPEAVQEELRHADAPDVVRQWIADLAWSFRNEVLAFPLSAEAFSPNFVESQFSEWPRRNGGKQLPHPASVPPRTEGYSDLRFCMTRTFCTAGSCCLRCPVNRALVFPSSTKGAVNILYFRPSFAGSARKGLCATSAATRPAAIPARNIRINRLQQAHGGGKAGTADRRCAPPSVIVSAAEHWLHPETLSCRIPFS
jgi:hypothetical protein